MPEPLKIDWDSEAICALPARDRRFLERIYAGDLARYERRLRNLDFANLGRVLDAGAGFGQWSLALTQLGNQVVPADIDLQRLRVLGQIARGAARRPAVFGAQASLETLPLKDASFDGVFAFSSIYFLRYRLALDEFARLLKTGGLLYINTNGLGWYLYLLASGHNATEGYNPRAYALHSLLNSWLQRPPPFSEQLGTQYISSRKLTRQLEARGFEILARAGDGLIDRPGRGETHPLLPATFLGLEAVYEVLARKVER